MKNYYLLSLVQSAIMSIGLTLYLKANIFNFLAYVFAIWLLMMIVNPLSYKALNEINKSIEFRKSKKL